MELRHDWSLLAPPVTIPGAMINMDGVMHAVSGVISYARVAHLMGDKPMADRMAYLASKMLVTFYDIWLAPEWMEELFAWGLSDQQPDPIGLAALMTYNGNSIGRGGVGFWCNTYGDFSPELLDFYRAHFYDKVKDFEYRKWEAWSAKDSPYWPTKPVNAEPYRSVQWGINAERAVHHYSKDPHFIARALLFHEPLEQTQNYAIEHSGQVLAAFIAGQHPMVLFPANARFGGNVWDAKTRTLTTARG
jgi:hypothetical protein